MVFSPEKNNGATGLKLGMQTQLDSANNISSSLCMCKAKNVKNSTSKSLQQMSSKQTFCDAAEDKTH